jgi:group I intron endonuclease
MDYYQMSQLMKDKRPIGFALLKYGYSNFRLEILEYCEKKEAVLREQYYLDLFEPEYNILKVAGSTLGFKHSEKTINHMKILHLIDNEVRKNRSLARLGVKASDETRAKISAATTALIGIPVRVKNVNTNEETEYVNLTEAGKALGVSRTAIKKALDLGRVLKKMYYIRKK